MTDSPDEVCTRTPIRSAPRFCGIPKGDNSFMYFLLWAYQKSPRTRQEPISLSVVTFASTLIELYIVISTMSCTFRALSWNNYCFSLMETSNMSSKYIIYKQ